MPASSRKRNKGKERKAKKEADKAEAIRVDSHEFWRSFCGSNQCDHGHAVILADDHPVSSFMDQFYINLRHKRMTVAENLRALFESHTRIWNNEMGKEIVLDILVHIGTNMLLSKWVDIANPLCVAQSIVVLEKYNGTKDIDLVLDKRAVGSKWRDLKNGSGSIRRDALKFYRKRTSCKCLKKMHLEARKTTPKVGFCWYCKEEKDRVLLSVCSRCMVDQYCSRECQVADWSEHKKDCDAYVKANSNREEDEL